MTYLLMKVSGAAMLEKTLKNTKPGYTEYSQHSRILPTYPASQKGING